MQLHIKKFTQLTNIELYEIGKLRSEVFVVEQNCPYLDLDGKDYECIHLFTVKNDNFSSYLRILPAGLSYNTPSIGRVLVKKEYRGQGLSKDNLYSAIEYIFEIMKEDKITIGAQKYLEFFYSSFGFKRISPDYDEDGILHLDMELSKSDYIPNE